MPQTGAAKEETVLLALQMIAAITVEFETMKIAPFYIIPRIVLSSFLQIARDFRLSKNIQNYCLVCKQRNIKVQLAIPER